jgi:hypothetical protein
MKLVDVTHAFPTARDRRHRARQVPLDLTLHGQEAQQRPQPDDHALRRTDAAASGLARHELADRRRVQLRQRQPAAGPLPIREAHARDTDIVCARSTPQSHADPADTPSSARSAPRPASTTRPAPPTAQPPGHASNQATGKAPAWTPTSGAPPPAARPRTARRRSRSDHRPPSPARPATGSHPPSAATDRQPDPADTPAPPDPQRTPARKPPTAPRPAPRTTAHDHPPSSRNEKGRASISVGQAVPGSGRCRRGRGTSHSTGRRYAGCPGRRSRAGRPGSASSARSTRRRTQML